MKCNNCGTPMVALFISYVCDVCDPPRGAVVPATPATKLSAWVEELLADPPRAIRAIHAMNYTAAKDTLDAIVLAATDRKHPDYLGRWERACDILAPFWNTTDAALRALKDLVYRIPRGARYPAYFTQIPAYLRSQGLISKP